MPVSSPQCGAASGAGDPATAQALTRKSTALSKSPSSQYPAIHVGSGGVA